MPIGSCIADATRRRIAQYGMFKEPELVTEDVWIEYFETGRDLSQMKHHKMNVSLLDVKSRVSGLIHDMDMVLEKMSMESLVDTDPKRVIGYVVEY
ncbi:unnamed protein product [Aphanomyces euteiches]